MARQVTVLEDFADLDRQVMIHVTTHEELASTVVRLRTAIERAVFWLDRNAPGRAREELLEATKD